MSVTAQTPDLGVFSAASIRHENATSICFETDRAGILLAGAGFGSGE